VRQETLVFGTVTSGVQDIADAAFGTSHWANLYIQSIEVNLEFNPIDANELIPFGDIRPIDVMTTVVRVTGNLVMYLPNPVNNEIFQIMSGSEFAFGVLLSRGTKKAKLVVRRACPERIQVNASGDKTSLEQVTIDFRGLAPIIAGTIYAPYNFTVSS
jgi:hypothetical protein